MVAALILRYTMLSGYANDAICAIEIIVCVYYATMVTKMPAATVFWACLGIVLGFCLGPTADMTMSEARDGLL